jgi:hypothetical protein
MAVLTKNKASSDNVRCFLKIGQQAQVAAMIIPIF